VFGPVLAGDRVVAFLGVYPLYADELALKLEAGADELADRLADAAISELLDPRRPSVA
jgi:hypothetical protein